MVIEIKKSKFIGYVYKVDNFSDIKNILDTLKVEHRKASHICYAYKLIGDNYTEKAFDDGEPNGTAGKPILNVINKQNLSNIMIVVVRYFGGIKLGAGGLVRAYTKAASHALQNFSPNN